MSIPSDADVDIGRCASSTMVTTVVCVVGVVLCLVGVVVCVVGAAVCVVGMVSCVNDVAL